MTGWEMDQKLLACQWWLFFSKTSKDWVEIRHANLCYTLLLSVDVHAHPTTLQCYLNLT